MSLSLKFASIISTTILHSRSLVRRKLKTEKTKREKWQCFAQCQAHSKHSTNASFPPRSSLPTVATLWQQGDSPGCVRRRPFLGSFLDVVDSDEPPSALRTGSAQPCRSSLDNEVQAGMQSTHRVCTISSHPRRSQGKASCVLCPW